MKKHQLLEKAMRDYPAGTRFTWKNDTIPYIATSNGIFHFHEQSIVMQSSDTYVVFNGNQWAEIVQEHPLIIAVKNLGKPESILSGKCAIQVNNEREFKLLMDNYKSKGWKWNGGSYTDYTPRNMEFNTAIEYSNFFVYDCDPDNWVIIPFSDFAKEVGIEVPVLVMRSEDGADMYVGDDNYGAEFINGKWELDLFFDNDSSEYVPYKMSLTSSDLHSPQRYRAFSTKEAAESWIKEQNKPKEIVISSNSTYPIHVCDSGACIVCEDTENHISNILLSAQEIQEMYTALKSLKS